MTREWDSEAYHRLSDPQLTWALKVVSKLDLLHLRGDEHILDAGCGSGRVTAAILQKFPRFQVTAVDASENMVLQARGTLEGFSTRVSVERWDLLDLPYNNEFDVVFSTAVFHWIHDHDRLFKVLFRVLKSGGDLLAQCGGGPNLQSLRDRIQQTMEREKFRTYFANWSRVWEYPEPELTIKRLQRAGFVDVSSSLEAAPVSFESAKHYRDFLVAMILHPYLERLTVELKTQFCDILVRQAEKDQPPFVLDYWRLNLQGRKPA